MTTIDTPVQRAFLPGSEWLYYKIYTGSQTADRILGELIFPFTQQMKTEGLIDQWFFIRYGDPDNHLRVRFHLSDPSAFGKVVAALTPLLEEYYDLKLVWKVQLDVYKRELERYGAATICLSEQLFHYESDLMAQFLGMIDGEEGEELRWLFGLRAINQLLTDFGLNEDQKIALLATLKTGFMTEFGIEIARRTVAKYRESLGIPSSVQRRRILKASA